MPEFEETIERLKIKFKKHPESKKFSDKRFQWHSYFWGTFSIIEIPICKNSIIPSNQEEQFANLMHEIGHRKERHLRLRLPCAHWFDSCLQYELEADLNVIESLKKIRKKFNKDFWLENVNQLRKQCKNCLKVINENRCPPDIIKKIEKYLDIIDQALKLKSRKIIFPEREEEREHRMILKILIKSDPRMEKLIENENIKEKGIKFVKHPESHKFCDTPERIIWRWTTLFNRKILIPLDKNNSIIPYDKDDRIFNLAHEFGHIEPGIFWKSHECGYSLRSCLSVELKAHLLGIKRLQRINIQFDKIFWRNKLLNKWFSCEECLEILNQGKCPKKERERIKKSLCEIARNVKE